MHQRAFDVQVEADGRVAAPAEVVFQLLADYHTHHPAILTPAFSNLTVEQGGIGGGTVISYSMKMGGRTRQMRALISEPRPNVLLETDLETGAVTTFEVRQGAEASRVRIRTEFTSSPGIQGWFERRFAPPMLSKIYQQELANLDAYARQYVENAIATNAQVAMAG